MGLLKELPQPGSGKTGWPWIEESPPLPQLMPDGNLWPRISIVTPSYNHGGFIEETIRSVLLQNYPNLEYIIMDGGSTDDSVDIIQRYSPWLTHWISQKDEGQSDAINAGMNQTTGVVVNWLCSDDLFTNGAFFHIARMYQSHPDAVAWAGKCSFIREGGEPFHTAVPIVGSKRDFAKWGNAFHQLKSEAWVAQPSCFFSRQAFIDVGGLNKDLYFSMDVELWMKLAEHGEFQTTNEIISCIRWYPDIKTLQDYPGRMVEHVVVNWNLGVKAEAKNKMVQFGERFSREHVLAMDTKSLMILVMTWLYRKLLKNPITKLQKRLQGRV